MRKTASTTRAHEIRINGQHFLGGDDTEEGNDLNFVEVADAAWRRLFDEALDEIHYAGSCQRVGRCMRLAVVRHGEWVGGIVLGSTFPNMAPRDKALGLDQYLRNTKASGLVSPFARENTSYWEALQHVVNHARTFVFPEFQGAGIGVHAHAALLTEGRRLWEEKYRSRVVAFDTLCTHMDSRLFSDNGWQLVGQTKGYSRDPGSVLSKRAFSEEWQTISDNAGLGLIQGGSKWWIWVRGLRDDALPPRGPSAAAGLATTPCSSPQ